MTPDYSPMFKRWHSAETAPTDGTLFMGRLTGTNRAIAVKLDGEDFVDTNGKPVAICQWISFIDFADIRACVWRRM